MKKIIYLSAALLAFSTTELVAEIHTSTSSVMDNLNCTVAAVKYGQEDLNKGKLGSDYLKTIKRCVNNQKHITKDQQGRYTNFNAALEQAMKHDKKLADFVENASK